MSLDFAGMALLNAAFIVGLGFSLGQVAVNVVVNTISILIAMIFSGNKG